MGETQLSIEKHLEPNFHTICSFEINHFMILDVADGVNATLQLIDGLCIHKVPILVSIVYQSGQWELGPVFWVA